MRVPDRRRRKGLGRILADQAVQAHLDTLEAGGGDPPLSGQDREWLHEVRRVASLIASGEVEAPEAMKDSIAYVLADPHRTIAESEAWLADPEFRASLDRARRRGRYLSSDEVARRIPGLAAED